MLASIRFDQLHVLFLLQLSFMDSLTEPDSSIVDVSDQMLALVVEAILLRDQLVFSGTSLLWKVNFLSIPGQLYESLILFPWLDRTLWAPSRGDNSSFNAKTRPHAE